MSEIYSKEDEVRIKNVSVDCICSECNLESGFSVYEAIFDATMFEPCSFCGSDIAFSTKNIVAIDSIKKILTHFKIKYPENIQIVKPKTERQVWKYYRAKQQKFIKEKSCVTCNKFSDCTFVYDLDFKACDRKIEPIKSSCPCIATCKLFINGFSDLCKKRSQNLNRM